MRGRGCGQRVALDGRKLDRAVIQGRPHACGAFGQPLATISAAFGIPRTDALLPSPRREEAERAVRARLGLRDDEHERILGPARKMAERDLSVAVAQRWDVGATTVSASVAIAAAGGVEVFATGGIGGVHRGVEITGDVSADLDALASHPVITVCAGAKAFLDLPRTLEYLETYGVPVLGWQHDWFPAFYTRSSGLPVPHRVESATDVAAIFSHRSRERTGLLVAAPIPEADQLDQDRLDHVVRDALDECTRADITGAAVTPFVLGRIAEATEGRSVPANLALAENNARVAAEIAVALAEA